MYKRICHVKKNTSWLIIQDMCVYVKKNTPWLILQDMSVYVQKNMSCLIVQDRVYMYKRICHG